MGNKSSNSSVFKGGRSLARSVYQSVTPGSEVDSEEDEEQVDLLLELWQDVEHTHAHMLEDVPTAQELDRVFRSVSQAINVLVNTPSAQPVNRSALSLLQFAFKKPKLSPLRPQLLDLLLGMAQNSDSIKKRTRLKALEAVKFGYFKREELHCTQLFFDTQSRLLRMLENAKEEDAIKMQILDLLSFAVLNKALHSEAKHMDVLFQTVHSTNSSTSLEIKLRVIELFDDYVRQCEYTTLTRAIVVNLCDQFPLNRNVEVRKAELDVLRDVLKHANEQALVPQYDAILEVFYSTLEHTNSLDLKLRILECFDTVLRKPVCKQHHDKIITLVFAFLDNNGDLELQLESLDVLRAVFTLRHLDSFHAPSELRYFALLQNTKPALKLRVLNNVLLLKKKKNLCLALQSDKLIIVLCELFSNAKERVEHKRAAICALASIIKTHPAKQHEAMHAYMVQTVCTNVLASPQPEVGALHGIAFEILCTLLEQTKGTGESWKEPFELLCACLVSKQLDIKDLCETLGKLEKSSLGSIYASKLLVFGLARGMIGKEKEFGKPVAQLLNALLFTSPQYFTSELFAIAGFPALFARYLDLFILKGEVKDRFLLDSKVPLFVKQFIDFERCLVDVTNGDSTKVIVKRKAFFGQAKLMWTLLSAEGRVGAKSALKRLPSSTSKLVWGYLPK